MRFILLTYNDSRHGRCGCVLVSVQGVEWSVLEGVTVPVDSPGWGIMDELRACLLDAPDLQVRSLDMPDDEPMHGDAEGMWEQATHA